MERLGGKATPLSGDELRVLFQVLDEGEDLGEARQRLPQRDRVTVSKAYNVVKKFNLLSLSEINDEVAAEIARKAGYGATGTYVQRLFTHWYAWRSGRTTILDGQAHQSFLKTEFVWLRMELQTLSASFPKGWKPDYWPDYTSYRLKWLGEGNGRSMVWVLEIEQKSAWLLLLEHLRTGLPETFRAVEEVKQSYARYCQLWKALEDRYRAQAQESRNKEPAQVDLNGSHFYRSILNEVDKDSENSSEAEYRVLPGSGGSALPMAGSSCRRRKMSAPPSNG